MGNSPEVVCQVGIYDIRVAVIQLLIHFDHRPLGVFARAIGILFIW